MTSYRTLGLRPVVNAAATLTVLGGSRLAPGVAEAMAAASTGFVDLPGLSRAVGARLAELTGNEAGYVSCGGSAGVTLTVAACMTDDPEVFGRLDGRPQRHEVAMFRGHRNPYDYAARQLGARIVEFDADPAPVLGPSTACVLWFAGAHYADGAPPLDAVLAAGRQHGIPVLVDAAAQVPPVSSLWTFTGQGAAAVIVSGGKGLRGPQSSGLVLGRRSLLDVVRSHASPNHAVGRGMKVGKEELLGLLAAVEWTLAQDEPALLRGYEDSVRLWVSGLGGLPGVTAWRGYPSEAGQPHGRAMLRVAASTGWTVDGLKDALWDRDPRIAVLVAGDALALNPQTLAPGEDRVVLAALTELLSGSSDG